MTGRLVVVSGTGTGIGKTHFSEALLGALAVGQARVAGLKPVETGVDGAGVTDAARLERASSFHVKRLGVSFLEAVSPHLAARLAGLPIPIEALVAEIAAVRLQVDTLLVELPGGLFSPLSDALVNADLAKQLEPDATLLVASDRLGVLHEVLATWRAAATVPLRIDGFVLVAPEIPDTSTSRNAAELGRLVADVARIVAVPRATVQDLAHAPQIRDLAGWLQRP
jgi:dethiobiotin synthetase